MKRGSLCVLASVICLASAQLASAETLLGLTPLGPFQIGPFQIGPFDTIVSLNSDSPTLPTGLKLVRGLTEGESLVAIDIRPATGVLFGVGVSGNNAQLYSIDLATGQATAVGSVFANLDNPPGTTFGFDFNPTIDRVRLVSSTNQNIVFNPDTGAVSMPLATDLFYATGDVNEGTDPDVSNIAYDNNVGGAMTSQQRGIDVETDSLVTVANNAGTLGTIGPLGNQLFDAVAATGFDVSGSTGVGYAIITRNLITAPGLYTINLTSGLATLRGFPLLGMLPVNGLSVLPPPAPLRASR